MSEQAPRSGVEALQSAWIARLKADDAIRALVGARVFDQVPGDKDRPKAPYIYPGPVSRRRYEGGGCVDAKTVTFRVFVVSTDFGRYEAWAVIEAIAGALNNKELAVVAPWSTAGDTVKAIQDGDVVQPLDPKSAFADFSITLIRTGA